MPSALRANLRLFYFIPEKIVLKSSIFPDRATHRPSMAGATCPSPFGQVGNIFAFCGEPRGAVLWQPRCLISKFKANVNVMSLTKIQRLRCIEKQHQGSHFFASGSAEMNDDFSGSPGMDARRADSDRGVARARGQEKSRE